MAWSDDEDIIKLIQFNELNFQSRIQIATWTSCS